MSVSVSMSMIERHSLVEITPDDAALRVVKKTQRGLSEEQAGGHQKVPSSYLMIAIPFGITCHTLSFKGAKS